MGRLMRVTIASRRSDLARVQAYQVGEALQIAHPQIEINYSFHESLGDRNQNDPLWQMPEKGVFTQDFRKGLLRGDFDLVVHSWKDLAIEDDPETEIAATLPRADARDLLLVPKNRWPEIARAGPELRQLLAPINCAETFAAVTREREILRGYGGGCHQKIGVSVLRRPFGEITFLRGVTDDGRTLDSRSLESSKPRPAKIQKAQLWPLKPSDADWFTREAISVGNSQSVRVRASVPDRDLTVALWVAKADALPNDWQIEPGQ